MASLIGRIFRAIIFSWAFWVFLPAPSALAAPFAAIVMDARSGEVLYEKNADTRLHPASLTKMMTLYVVFQELEAGRIHLDDKVTVSKHAAAQPPSRLGLKSGQKIAVRYLIRAAAVKSANDAATALGEHVSGGEAAFAKRMTKTAKALGMSNSTFRNANGLTADGHLSTARDMNVLGRHLFYDFPKYYNIFSRRTADAGMAKVTNTNSRFLDGYEGADGIKTGYTVAAGFNLTASAQRGKKRIIATVFGGTSTAARNAKMAELMDLGFGAARNSVRENVPEAAPVPEDALISALEPAPADVSDAEGGSAKTIRVSGAFTRSLRPKARPVVEEVPDAVAVAIAEGVDGALGEALAAPAPDGTLEAQAEKLAAGEVATETLAETPAEALVETPLLDADAIAVADALDAVTAAPPEGTLEAQALALADGGAADAPAEALADDSLEAQALALASAEVQPDAVPIDPALSAARPKARPEGIVEVPAEDVLIAAEEPAVTEALPVEEVLLEELVVAEAPVTEAPLSETLVEEEAVSVAEAPVLTDVETVAAGLLAPLEETKVARNAPIFDSVEPELALAEVEEPEAEEVVVVKSTSGGRHWGVNVGDFASRSEAERALLKTALAESATLNQGLRKISEKSGSYHANFMGLTEEQAGLACRRLKARGVPCETLGPT